MLNKKATVGLKVCFTLSDEVLRAGTISRLLEATDPEGTDRQVVVDHIHPAIANTPSVTIACDELAPAPVGMRNDQAVVGMVVQFRYGPGNVLRTGTIYQIGPDAPGDQQDKSVSINQITPPIPGTATINRECSDLTPV